MNWTTPGIPSRASPVNTGMMAAITPVTGATKAALPIDNPRYKEAKPKAPDMPARAAKIKLCKDGNDSCATRPASTNISRLLSAVRNRT